MRNLLLQWSNWNNIILIILKNGKLNKNNLLILILTNNLLIVNWEVYHFILLILLNINILLLFC